MELEQEIEKNTLLGTNVPSKESTQKKLIVLIEKIICSINNVLHKISICLLFLLMFLTVADILGRFLFNNPITGTYELTGLILSIIIFFSMGATQLSKGHIEIDFLTNKMPRKLDHIRSFTVSLLLFALMILITWQLFEYTKRTWIGNEFSGDLGIPLYIFIGLTIFGAFSFALTYLLDAIQSLLKVVNNDES